MGDKYKDIERIEKKLNYLDSVIKDLNKKSLNQVGIQDLYMEHICKAYVQALNKSENTRNTKNIVFLISILVILKVIELLI
jgi:hypothetical protein